MAVFDESRTVRLLNEVAALIKDVDATDGSIGTGTFFGILYPPEVHAKPVVVRAAVRAHSQAIVEEMNTAEFREPLANLTYGCLAYREVVSAQNEYPKVERGRRATVGPVAVAANDVAVFRLIQELSFPICNRGDGITVGS